MICYADRNANLIVLLDLLRVLWLDSDLCGVCFGVAGVVSFVCELGLLIGLVVRYSYCGWLGLRFWLWVVTCVCLWCCGAFGLWFSQLFGLPLD